MGGFCFGPGAHGPGDEVVYSVGGLYEKRKVAWLSQMTSKLP